MLIIGLRIVCQIKHFERSLMLVTLQCRQCESNSEFKSTE